MTLKQLEAFYWAATLGTFAIAAERLHVTQSSLSKRITELEKTINKSLFDRSAQRAVLSAAGQALLPQVRTMLELAEQMKAGEDTAPRLSGPLRLGITELSATTWLPHLAKRVAQRFPLMELRPQVGLTHALERAIERGELDCAVITGNPSNPTLDYLTVAEVRFCWTASPDRLPQGAVVDSAMLTEHPLITSSTDAGLKGALHQWAAQGGVQLNEAMYCNSLTAILSMTIAGMGISFLPERYVVPLVQRRLLVTLHSNPVLPMPRYHLVWRRDDARRLVSEARTLIEEEVNFDAGNPLWEN